MFVVVYFLIKPTLLLFTVWLDASGRPVGNGGQGSASPQDVHVVDMTQAVNEKTSLVSQVFSMTYIQHGGMVEW